MEYTAAIPRDLLRPPPQPSPHRDLRSAGHALRRHPRWLAAHPLGLRQGADRRRLLRDARPLTIPTPVNLSNDFSKIAKAISPAVVNINTVTIPKQSAVKGRGNQPPYWPDAATQPARSRAAAAATAQVGSIRATCRVNCLQPLLRRSGWTVATTTASTRAAANAKPSAPGFIVDSRGYIVNFNNHVRRSADKIYVKLAFTDPDTRPPTFNGRPAHVIGVDPRDRHRRSSPADRRRIEYWRPPKSSSATPTAPRSARLGARHRQPLSSLSETVTAGIVLRQEPGSIQDARRQGRQLALAVSSSASSRPTPPSNPGNSGGPLVDMAGQVIGMNTAIYTQSMGSEGVGFAMPSNVIANVYNDLISPLHSVTRGSIGISFQSNLSSAVAREYGYANGGVLRQ